MTDGRGAPLTVLVKGAGEHSSATAHRLFRCGFRVAMTDQGYAFYLGR